jgi:hypothetical protein
MAELDPFGDGRAPDVPGASDEAYAYVDRAGGRHLPLNDRTGVRDAIARWCRTDFDSRRMKETARRRILAAARLYGIHVASDALIAKPVR